MAICSSVNALSLDRYAKLLGINPVHFSGAGEISVDGETLFPFRQTDSMFYQSQAYNAPKIVSREEIGLAIQEAEADIEDYLDTHVAPKWIEEEPHSLIQHFDPTVGYNFRNIRGQRVIFRTKRGQFLSGGIRATSLLADGVDVVYSDEDGDGFSETATITADIGTAYSLYEVKAYFPNQNGASAYEIRPPEAKSISGTTVTFIFKTWQMIRASILERFPSETNERIIDLNNADNLLETIDIYREYTDETADQCKFVYQPTGSDGETYEDSEQGGFIKLADPDINGVIAIPANYSDGSWSRATISGHIKYVKFNYISGYRYRPDRELNYWDELYPELARIIANLATARLEKRLVGKDKVTAKGDMLQKDMAVTKPGQYQYASQEMLSNPFGTRRGEIYAWMRLQKFQKRFMRYNR